MWHLGGLYSRNRTRLVQQEVEEARNLMEGRTPDDEVVEKSETARRKALFEEGGAPGPGDARALLLSHAFAERVFQRNAAPFYLLV